MDDTLFGVQKSYAKYIGIEVRHPHGVVLKTGEIYAINIVEPDYGHTCYMVRIMPHEPGCDIYIPYPDDVAIWDEWVPVFRSDDDEALR